MSGTSRIPRNDAPFDGYIRTSPDYLNLADPVFGTNYARLGLTLAEYNDWSDLRTAWNDIYLKYVNLTTRTRPITDDKNITKRDFIDFASPMLNRISGSAFINSSDREALRIKLRVSPTPRPAIITMPYPQMLSLGGGKIKVELRVQSDATRASMHPDAHSIEMLYQVGGTAPVSHENCASSAVYRKAIRVFDFGQVNATKRLFAFFRWKNETDDSKSGPFSTIVQVVIG